MKVFVFSALGLLLCAFFFVWLIARVRYRITDRHVRISLFGFGLRRIRLDRIASVSKRRGPGLAEHWWSTLRPSHRVLYLRKSRGLFRNVVITPRNRYAFKAELESKLGHASAPEEISAENAPAAAE